MREVVRCRALERVHIALDFFDATMSRVGAWVIGARATRAALLAALLEPMDRLKEAEGAGDVFARLAWLEESKALPMGDIWDYFCLKSSVPIRDDWISEVQQYDRMVAAERDR
jgi:L-rhamnose isomerase